jgi:hypothetical protein
LFEHLAARDLSFRLLLTPLTLFVLLLLLLLLLCTSQVASATGSHSSLQQQLRSHPPQISLLSRL